MFRVNISWEVKCVKIGSTSSIDRKPMTFGCRVALSAGAECHPIPTLVPNVGAFGCGLGCSNVTKPREQTGIPSRRGLPGPFPRLDLQRGSFHVRAPLFDFFRVDLNPGVVRCQTRTGFLRPSWGRKVEPCSTLASGRLLPLSSEPEVAFHRADQSRSQILCDLMKTNQKASESIHITCFFSASYWSEGLKRWKVKDIPRKRDTP